MAGPQGAWGIEIGQAGLKAIRVVYADVSEQAIATAFDYVPHPKLLSQPDANPEELVREALATFLSRNQLGNDLVALALPGQTSLAKFIQLPPVQASKVAEIVKYEARQQIPFPLEDVIWDYQALGNSSEEGGFMLDAEVGLFAMKREQVQHQMAPFAEKNIELELLQIAPIALYNYLCFDHLGQLPGQFNESDEYVVALDMGCDATTLLVTNGKKIWNRNVSIGGNHFTRALTKEMKLTFAKAEHLKCNATKAPDPRAVFQAMKPVFNDYVTEIQRSMGFFSSVNRNAKIKRLVGVGNGFRLAGLQKFLQQNLQYEVEPITNFPKLVGDQVLTAPLFQENLLTFVVPYGLAIQALKKSHVRTSLLPPEIVVARKIRRKKPWAVATAATMLVGLALSAAGYGSVMASVSKDRFGDAEKQTEQLEQHAGSLKAAYSKETSRNKKAHERGDVLVGSLKSRENWLEIYKAIDECLPRDVGDQLDETNIKLMNRLSIKSITTKKLEELDTWFADPRGLPKLFPQFLLPDEKEKGPSGPGYVFTLQGVHYHDDGDEVHGAGTGYIVYTFLRNLQQQALSRVNPATGEKTVVDVRRLGISHATVRTSQLRYIQYFPLGKPGAAGQTPGGAMGGRFGPGGPGGPYPGGPAGVAPGGPQFAGSRPQFGPGPAPGFGPQPGNPALNPALTEDRDANKPIMIPITEFTVEFAWKPTPPLERGEPATPVPAVDNASRKLPADEPAPATTKPAAPPTAPPVK